MDHKLTVFVPFFICFPLNFRTSGSTHPVPGVCRCLLEGNQSRRQATVPPATFKHQQSGQRAELELYKPEVERVFPFPRGMNPLYLFNETLSVTGLQAGGLRGWDFCTDTSHQINI